MKKLIPFILSFLFVAVTAFSQNPDRWEEKADRMADWAERFAEKVERTAERAAENWEVRSEQTAENWERWAEDIADEVEHTFDRNVHVEIDGEHVFMGDICQAYLGIHSDEISKEKAQRLGFDNAYGSYVTRVVEGSAADKAGLQIFDYIYGIDDQRTSNNQDLSDIIADYKPGDEVTLHVMRDGESRTLQAAFGDYSDFNWRNEEDAFLGVRPHDRERGSDLDGVKVEIVSSSTAEEMGLEDGDVITGINSHEILDWTDVSAAINSLKPGETIEVQYERDGQAMMTSAPIKGRENQNHDYNYNYDYSSSEDWNWDWDWNWDGNDDDWDAGEGAFLGIYTDKISEKKARKLGYDNPYGTVVTGIIKGTAAEKAGLQPFDYIFGIDEYRVGENQSLGGILRKYNPGDEAVVHIYRKGQKKKVDLTFGSHADVQKEKKDKCQDPFLGIIQVHAGSSVDGVRIRPVRNSTAKKMGLEEDDIITEINGYPVFDWTDISTAIDMLSPGETIKVKYLRDDEERSVSDKIMSYAEAKNCDNCDCDDGRMISIDIDPDIDIRIGGRNDRDRDERDRDDEPRMDIEDVDVRMETISSRDADNMRSKGVDMPIESTLELNRLDLSPNPNMGMFELEFDLPNEGQTIVRVYNPVGRVIYEYDLGRFSGDFADYIDISQNGAGFYFLQVSQDGKSFTRKIVLTKS